MQIGSVTLNGFALLAPMAGVTDEAYRSLCARFGAAATVTEMVSAKALHYHDKKTPELMHLSPDEHPAGIQLFGYEPDIMAEAAKSVWSIPRILLISIWGALLPKSPTTAPAPRS